MSTPSDAALARLESLAGAGRFLTEPHELEVCAIDGVAPRCVVRAASAEHAGEILRLAGEENLAVIPVGGGGELRFGMPPERYDVALQIGTAELISYDPGDLTLSVGAAMTVGALNQRLAEHNQFLPLDSHAGDFATIGGLLATNASGPLRHGFGTARDFLLGLEFLTGEGVRTKSGSRVVKSVSGFDIHKLMIGSLGTLGVITAAHFRTFPRPPAQATFVIRFADAAGACALRAAIARSHLQPRALDIVSPQAARLLRHADTERAAALEVPELDWADVRAYVGAEKAAEYQRQHREAAAAARQATARESAPPLFSSEDWSVLVAAGGNERVVERHCRELEILAEKLGARGFAEAKPLDAGTASLDGCEEWRWVRSFPDLARRSAPLATLLKLSVLPSEFERALKHLAREAERAELGWAAVVRAAGVIYFALLPPQSDEAALTRLAGAVTACARGELGRDAAAVIELCPTALKRRLNIWCTPLPPAEIALMRALKREFDPKGILSPGRFRDGI
jgi:glycolate oxidase FAD binding subunit